MTIKFFDILERKEKGWDGRIFVPEKRCFVTREAKKQKKGKEKEKPSSVLLTEECEFHTFAARSLTLKCIVMATPIAPTPELTGKAAEEFLKEIAECKKASPEEKSRIRANAQWVRDRMDFEF